MRGKQSGNVTFDQIAGFQNMAQNISEHIGIIAQDPNEKARVKQYGDVLGKMMNEVKALAQQAAEKMQAEASQGAGVDAETQAKIQSMLMLAKAKADNSSQTHAQKTAQRQIQFELEQRRADEKLKHDLKAESMETNQAIHHEDMKAASSILTTSATARASSRIKSKSKE